MLVQTDRPVTSDLSRVQTHPDFPKKPLTPYFRFFMEKRAKYAKIHPEMSNLDLTKILSKKYKELPDKKKVRLAAEPEVALVSVFESRNTKHMFVCPPAAKVHHRVPA